MTKLQKLARKVKNAAAITELAIDTYAENPTPAAEAEADACMDTEIEFRHELAAEIVKMTYGQIDEETAYKMTYTHKLYDLIARQAG